MIHFVHYSRKLVNTPHHMVHVVLFHCSPHIHLAPNRPMYNKAIKLYESIVVNKQFVVTIYLLTHTYSSVYKWFISATIKYNVCFSLKYNLFWHKIGLPNYFFTYSTLRKQQILLTTHVFGWKKLVLWISIQKRVHRLLLKMDYLIVNLTIWNIATTVLNTRRYNMNYLI